MRGKTVFGLTMAIALFASLLAIIPIGAAIDTRMYLDPSEMTVDQGSIFTLEVWVENVNDLYAWEFKIKIDTTVLTLLKPPKEGPFLKSGGFPTFLAWSYNAQSGVLLVGCTLLGVVPTVDGTGIIAEVRFIADTPGKTTTIDLFEEKKYDHNLNLIPELEPGDSVVTTQWPPSLWDAELWLSAAKGGKIWTEWQVADLEPNYIADPTYWDTHPYFWNLPMHWPEQTIYTRIRNTGAVTVRVRTMIKLYDTATGWVQTQATNEAYCGPGETVVCEAKAGLLDPYQWFWFPGTPYPHPQQYGSTWLVTGQLQFTIDGLTWYYWESVTPDLPGDGTSRVTPGGDTGKFKVTEPANMAPWNYDGYITGTVMENGIPIEGATVTVTLEDSTVITTTTDENGQYPLITVPNPPDPYFTWVSTDVTVDVSATGYLDDSAVFTVDAGWTTAADFILVPAP